MNLATALRASTVIALLMWLGTLPACAADERIGVIAAALEAAPAGAGGACSMPLSSSRCRRRSRRR